MCATNKIDRRTEGSKRTLAAYAPGAAVAESLGSYALMSAFILR